MKKIKLALLALALVCGSIGAYGKYKLRTTQYYIVPGTSYSSFQFQIAANSPSINCAVGSIGYVCTVLSYDGLPVGYSIPTADAAIVTVYN